VAARIEKQKRTPVLTKTVTNPTDNKMRLNSAIGYITPKDTLAGRQQATPSGIGSWRRPGDNGRFVGKRPRDTLWRHGTISPFSVKWADAGKR